MARKHSAIVAEEKGLSQDLEAEVEALEGLREADIDRLLDENPTQVIHIESKKIRLPVSFKAFGIDEIEAYELPELPERHREFAFRWATDCSRTNAEWGRIFGVEANTIAAWKRYPKIVAYRNIIKGKKETRRAERYVILEDKAFDKLAALLDQDFADWTIESIRKAILDALGVSKGVVPTSGGTNINVNQNQGQVAGAQAGAQAEAKAEVGPQQVDLAKMREQINELELLEAIVGKGGVVEQKPAPAPIIGQEEATS